MRSRYPAMAVLAGIAMVHAETPCHCDPAQPETMRARECSLCAEAEKEPAGVDVFFRRDINPRKPNRWLAMPRMHTRELHPLAELPPGIRTKLWTEAIEKAKSMWGPEWAVAYNGDRVRTQCHAHIHAGKLLPGVEFGPFATVNSPAEIAVPAGGGVWVHPVEGKLHVHTGEQITETVLLR